MPTVNHYFQSGRTIGNKFEQNLYEDLIIESMKIYGFEVYYIPRKPNNKDIIFTEDPLNSYEFAYPIEMYMENVGGFEGEGELLTKFGLEIRDSANFIVARRRWQSVVGDKGQTVLENRPAEGDVIYFPLTKSYFEIRKVDGQTPFYQVGKLYIYKMSCELMQFSNEVFNTGVEEIDSTIGALSNLVDNFSVMQENGVTDPVLQEANEPTPITLEEYKDNNDLLNIDNDKFDVDIDKVLDFSEKNPFGEVYK
jgi:hypothetical protein